MSHLFNFIVMAWTTLRRQKVQAGLAVLGVTAGVAALITSLALGRGAQDSIQDQLLAAGANMILVTAGNYQVERSQGGEVHMDHGSIQDLDSFATKVAFRIAKGDLPFSALVRDAAWRLGADWLPGHQEDTGWSLPVHFEDDPMAEHDHPTAKERLGDAMAGLGAAATLTLDDARAIREEIEGVQFVASGVHENARVLLEDGSKQWFTRLHGTESGLPNMRSGWEFPYGRFLTEAQVAGQEQVMVLGQVVAERLFGAGVNPVGRTVLLWNQPFRITGVVGSRSWATQPAPGDDQFDAIYVPVSTVHHLLNLSKLNTITLTTRSVGDTSRVAREVTDLLRQRHGINEMMADDFTVRTQAQQSLGKGLPPELARVVAGNAGHLDTLTIEQISNSLQRANWTMLALLAGVATVSLLVGGIGVMNLLLLSVTQRTREIGLRIAMGARRRDIASQFLFEAVIVSLFGGLLGIALGVMAANSLEALFAWQTSISALSVLLALFAAALLGIFSGVYPARRAAAFNPIRALHHE